MKSTCLQKITRILIIIWSFMSFLSLSGLTFGLGYIDQDSRLINQDSTKVIDTSEIENPLRDGSYGGIRDPEDSNQGVGALIEEGQIDSFAWGRVQTLQYIKNIINYILWFLWFVALIYLLYHGWLILSSWNDEAQYKKWRWGLKQASIAIWWIWLSWFLVTFIFYVIELVISTSPS